MAETRARVHVSYLEKIITSLKTDDRFEALLAAGTLKRETLSDFSSLDVILVARPNTYEEVYAKRYVFAAQIGGLMAAFPADYLGKPQQLVCLYGPELTSINITFVTRKDLVRETQRPKVMWMAADCEDIKDHIHQMPIAAADHTPDWFELHAWVWLYDCAAKLLRGELYEAISQLDFIRQQILGPMLQRRLGKPQSGLKEIDMLPSPFNTMLAATIAVYSRESLYSALRSSIRLYMELRKDSPPEHPVDDMPQRLNTLLEQFSFKE